MKSLYFCSTWVHAGKSLVLSGIGLKLKQKGLNLTYFKPLGTKPKKKGDLLTGQSVIFMKEILALKEPLEKLCPLVLTQDLIVQAYKGEIGGLEEKVTQAFKLIAKGKDIVLIEGAGSLDQGTFLGLSDVTLSKGLNSKVILIDKFSMDISVDSILAAKKKLGSEILGVILNHVPLESREFIKKRIVPFLIKKGVDVLGILPKDSLLRSITVKNLRRTLGGEIICCLDRQDELVEKFSIGAMNVEEALNYFKRYRNKAVITGGDRSDIQLAALETSTKALILTGNLYPNDIIVAKAEEKGVPILLVKGDTLSAVERVEGALRQLEVYEKRKVKRGLELVEKGLNLPLLYKKIGVK